MEAHYMSNFKKPKTMNTTKEYIYWMIYGVIMLFIVAAVVIFSMLGSA
jgi:hypothetical protein